MNYINQDCASIWNQRVKECMARAGYTSQQKLVDDFKKKYGIKCTQTNISRWTRVGESKTVKDRVTKEPRKTEIGFPSYNNMLLIADFFGVDVGYLTGETDSKSFDIEETSKFLGLESNTVEYLHNMTQPARGYSNINGQFVFPKDISATLNRLFTNKKFWDLIGCFQDLDETFNIPETDQEYWDAYGRKYDAQTQEEALGLLDCVCDSDFEGASEEAISAKTNSDEGIDRDYTIREEKAYNLCVYRYQLAQAFEEMVLDMYPKGESL